MTQKTIKRMIVVLAVLAIALYFVASTYARYASTLSGDATVKVAKWAVTINDDDMTNASTDIGLTFTEGANENVVAGYIAPNSSLYADFVIDPAGSQVAMDYSFKLGAITAPTGVTLPSSIAVEKVVKVASDGQETVINANADGEYTGEILLTDQAALTTDDSVTVRVYVKWTNDDTKNAEDTTAGVAAPELTMNVTAKAQQHI